MTAPRTRERWLDALRILAAFGVIVNHTNSDVFQASQPTQATWWLSILWYYVSKLAVPLFVLVSGAVLLPRQDGYRKALKRILRVLGALMLFSYGYYLYDAWVYHGLWPRAANIGAFLHLVWTQQITDGFWYLYFYLGLMVLLPFLQRLASALRPRDLPVLSGLCFFADALWPLVTHYVPALTPPGYFQLPLCTGYIGLFFAGHLVRQHYRPTRTRSAWAAVVLVSSLLLSVCLTYVEVGRVAPGAKYWFMDNRMTPSLFTITAALSLMLLAKTWSLRSPVVTELGACAFGIYLVQDFLIAQTKQRFFLPLCTVLPAFPAVLIWETLVFAVALALAWLLRRVPGVRKVL